MNKSSNSNRPHPGEFVRKHVIPTGMSVTKAAEILGIGRPALSNFLNGKSALSEEMATRLETAFGANAEDLIDRQARYKGERRSRMQSVSSTAKTFVPPFLAVKSTDIDAWANEHRSRHELPVLLRILIHSTCSSGLQSVDFPGNDDAQRSGWDGRLTATFGNPWVPEGVSGWELGTGKEIKRKADGDYNKRTSKTDEVERLRTTFVFVTPRRWPGKESWLRDKQSEGKWQDVRALDANDLEQWVEQSIPAQIWFSERENPRLPLHKGVKSLDKCWREWCADCEPEFTRDVFREYISSFGKKLIDHLLEERGSVLRIVADSRLEALAFIAAAFEECDHATKLKDRVVIFTKPGIFPEFLAGPPDFIPVIAEQKVKKELSQSGLKLSAVFVDYRIPGPSNPDISLEPLSLQSFRDALTSMGLDQDRTDQLARESGRSLTVLRRRLSQNEAIRTPDWSDKEELAKSLAPVAFAGAWATHNSADQYLMSELAGCSHEELEEGFTRLFNLEDSPVWKVGGYQGVVSKIDAQFCIARWVSPEGMIGRFLKVAEIALSERDPALDLPRDDRWAAVLYGKAREISSPLREGIGESLVLLAVYGSSLFGDRTGQILENKVAGLVRRLLHPMDEDRLLSQSPNLPLYAEAAPEEFLDIMEKDLPEGNTLSGLMTPPAVPLFGGRSRVDLLYGLEILAWQPDLLPRVVILLAQLAKVEPDDNLLNKPSYSLRSIFRSWLPGLEHRIEALRLVVKHNADVGWRIASEQFSRTHRTGHYTRRPMWRDYATGHGGGATRHEYQEFVKHCIKICIQWVNHTRDTLVRLIESSTELLNYLPEIERVVSAWARKASDEDRAWLRERTRKSMRYNQRRSFREETPDPILEQAISSANRVYDSLEPEDPVWRHAWLFEAAWVEELLVDPESVEDDDSYEKQLESMRHEALEEIWASRGEDGVVRLALRSGQPDVIGLTVARLINTDEARLSFIATVLQDADITASPHHQELLRGFFKYMEPATAVSLAERHCGDKCENEVGVRLLCLAPFSFDLWSQLGSFGATVSRRYWENVEPSRSVQSARHLNYAAARLLDAGRCEAAWKLTHVSWGELESQLILRILSMLPTAVGRQQNSIRTDAYRIRKALQVLTKRGAFNREELARLEWLNLDVLQVDDKGFPNLNMEIETKPEFFSQVISYAYRPEFGCEDAQPTDEEMNRARTARLLLGSLTRVPGHDDTGKLCLNRLRDWIRNAQGLCEVARRKSSGDRHIGQLLSNALVGQDDIWPCEVVRDVLNEMTNEEINDGFIMGRFNASDFQERGDGHSESERELAEQYERWAKALDYSHTRVARTLRELAKWYRDIGEQQDRKDAIEQRLGY